MLKVENIYIKPESLHLSDLQFFFIISHFVLRDNTAEFNVRKIKHYPDMFFFKNSHKASYLVEDVKMKDVAHLKKQQIIIQNKNRIVKFLLGIKTFKMSTTEMET